MGEAVIDGHSGPPPTQKIYHVDALGKDKVYVSF